MTFRSVVFIIASTGTPGTSFTSPSLESSRDGAAQYQDDWVASGLGGSVDNNAAASFAGMSNNWISRSSTSRTDSPVSARYFWKWTPHNDLAHRSVAPRFYEEIHRPLLRPL